ncbi:hypothetical protein CKO42_10590 [Lamprobacter modestohalophilus]|uniref:Uncharacterized protein n=1 Tax=Lamprobacter modestohalophilus TaxID=1064514 RepID=A0A9X1B4L7_9GAMM|nr:hypothetical protein [Lamprobacter modestohalophilus]MBK1618871.1 hypothetical protein [Lamprobacter modestohalophilus]
MAENIDSLVLEHLRAIRADIADLKREVAGNSIQIAAMGQQLAGLTTAVYSSKGDVDGVLDLVAGEPGLSCSGFASQPCRSMLA